MSVAVRRYVLRAAGEIELGPFVGSSLRGAIGRGLRRLVCATRMPVCDGCPVRSACAYALLHDGYTPPEVRAGTSEHAPPPLWLRDVEPGRRMRAGDTLRFSLAAFGPAIRSLPYVDEAIRSLRHGGIGRGRGAVELVEATDEVSGDLDRLISARVDALERQIRAGDRGLEVRLVTPVAIRLKGAAWADPRRPRPTWAERLVGGAVRRSAALSRRWLDVPAAEAPRASRAVAEAGDLRVLEERVQMRSVRRYSSTEARHVEFHGAVGALRIGGAGLQAALPWLAAAELLSVGSGTTFGFGRIELGAA